MMYTPSNPGSVPLREMHGHHGVGYGDGEGLGIVVGWGDGDGVGGTLGDGEGYGDGTPVGCGEGSKVGSGVGYSVGNSDTISTSVQGVLKYVRFRSIISGCSWSVPLKCTSHALTPGGALRSPSPNAF